MSRFASMSFGEKVISFKLPYCLVKLDKSCSRSFAGAEYHYEDGSIKKLELDPPEEDGELVRDASDPLAYVSPTYTIFLPINSSNEEEITRFYVNDSKNITVTETGRRHFEEKMGNGNYPSYNVYFQNVGKDEIKIGNRPLRPGDCMPTPCAAVDEQKAFTYLVDHFSLSREEDIKTLTAHFMQFYQMDHDSARGCAEYLSQYSSEEIEYAQFLCSNGIEMFDAFAVAKHESDLMFEGNPDAVSISDLKKMKSDLRKQFDAHLSDWVETLRDDRHID